MDGNTEKNFIIETIIYKMTDKENTYLKGDNTLQQEKSNGRNIILQTEFYKIFSKAL